MCDCDHRLALHPAKELLLYRELDLAVERRGRLVEHEDGSVLEHDSSDCDALALPAGELHAALAHMRLVAFPAMPVLQAYDELMRVRLARGGLHLRVRRVEAPLAYVGRDRAVQERGVLRHHADRRAQAFLGDRADILPVDAYRAALQVIEPQKQ